MVKLTQTSTMYGLHAAAVSATNDSHTIYTIIINKKSRTHGSLPARSKLRVAALFVYKQCRYSESFPERMESKHTSDQRRFVALFGLSTPIQQPHAPSVAEKGFGGSPLSPR